MEEILYQIKLVIAAQVKGHIYIDVLFRVTGYSKQNISRMFVNSPGQQ